MLQADSKSATQASTQGDFPEIDDFLGSINLQKYKERFIDNGIEDLETVLELNDQHLDAIGIPLGYKLKIIKRIKTLRQEKGMTVPESRQGQRQHADNVATEARQVTNADYSELPPPSKEIPQKSALKNRTESVSQANNDYNQLAEGTFDEAQSHQSFLEALNAWRGVKPTTEDDKGQKQVRFEGQSANQGKKNFLANIDTKENNWNVNCLPSFQDGSTKTDEHIADLRFSQQKDSCWQCYKLFPKAQNVPCQFVKDKVRIFRLTLFQKFCSQGCLDTFEKANVL